jgi:Fur family transcriptional regulator, ferric uptake regulator
LIGAEGVTTLTVYLGRRREQWLVTTAQRRTRQRAAVEEILGRTDQFRTASQIHDDLRHSGSGIGLTTVYRTLQLMAGADQLDSIRTDDGETAYRRCSTGHHHHLVCRSCGRTVEVEGPAMESWTSQIAEVHGFRDVQHNLEIFGVCADCADAVAQPAPSK